MTCACRYVPHTICAGLESEAKWRWRGFNLGPAGYSTTIGKDGKLFRSVVIRHAPLDWQWWTKKKDLKSAITEPSRILASGIVGLLKNWHKLVLRSSYWWPDTLGRTLMSQWWTEKNMQGRAGTRIDPTSREWDALAWNVLCRWRSLGVDVGALSRNSTRSQFWRTSSYRGGHAGRAIVPWSANVHSDDEGTRKTRSLQIPWAIGKRCMLLVSRVVVKKNLCWEEEEDEKWGSGEVEFGLFTVKCGNSKSEQLSLE